MKKVLFALLIALFGATSLFACEECRKKELAAKQAKQGVLFTGWKLAPLQLGLGIDGWRGLADKNCDTVFTLGLWWMRQNSAVLSLCTISVLKNNYGIQLSPFIEEADNNYGLLIASAPQARTNYGLSLGLLTFGGLSGNYGLRIGILNVSGKVEEIQFVGVNCFDLLHLALINQGDDVCQIGLANFGREHIRNNDARKGGFQLGVFNSGDTACQIGLMNWHPGRDTAFQIGLLNYNPRSYIPVMPLVNFPMKPKEAEPRHGGTISVTVIGSDGKEEAVCYPTPAPPAEKK